MKNGICIYEPQVIFWGVAAGFHGYALKFINDYATCIYVRGFKKSLLYRRQLWKMGIRRYIPIIHSLEKADEECHSLVGFVVPNENDDEILKFHGTKYFHLMDYYLMVDRNREFLSRYHIDYVIGHTQMDKNCPFFCKYYPEYVGKVISLPFGYARRFRCYKPFDERRNLAVGLGSINPVDDPLLKPEMKRQFLDYFKGYTYMHPLRRYLQTHKDEFSEVVDAKFPDPSKQKDFSYDAVEILNQYTMFINDAGLSNFPPARTFEGIACGCVMVAEYNSIYTELGFKPDINYIAFPNRDYNTLKQKIKYYISHEEELNEIQLNSVELAKKFTHEAVAKELYTVIESEYRRNNINE